MILAHTALYLNFLFYSILVSSFLSNDFMDSDDPPLTRSLCQHLSANIFERAPSKWPFLVIKNIRNYIYDETVGSALKHRCVRSRPKSELFKSYTTVTGLYMKSGSDIISCFVCDSGQVEWWYDSYPDWDMSGQDDPQASSDLMEEMIYITFCHTILINRALRQMQ